MTKLKMEVVAAVAAWAVASTCHSLPAVRDLVPGLCPRDIGEAGELQKSLSPGAKVYFPGSPEFKAASTRWSVLNPPTVNVVVVPATEKDVSETVRWTCLHQERPREPGMSDWPETNFADLPLFHRSNMRTRRSCLSWLTMVRTEPSQPWGR